MKHFLFILIFLLGSCSHQLRSGKYVKALESDSYNDLALAYDVPEQSIKQANPKLVNPSSKWVFIPSHEGLLSTYLNSKKIGGWSSDYSNSYFAGKFTWPVPSSSSVSSDFGIRSGKHHDGIDIAAPEGSAIVAVADGKVTYSGNDIKGYGNLTIISHSNGYFSVYAHASKNFLEQGENVHRGQVIANVGQTGNATGPHLHFEVRHFDRSVNPLSFLEVPSSVRYASKLDY